MPVGKDLASYSTSQITTKNSTSSYIQNVSTTVSVSSYSSVSSVTTVVNSANYTLVKAILPGEPEGVLYDPLNNQILVSEPLQNKLVIINASSFSIVENVNLDISPKEMLLDPSNGLIYAASFGGVNGSGIVVINGSSDGVVANIRGVASSTGMTFDHENNDIYIANPFTGALDILHTTNNSIVQSISLHAAPFGVVFDSSNNKVYVGVPHFGLVDVIDASTNKVTGNITIESVENDSSGIGGLTFNPINNEIYVTEGQIPQIAVINASTNKLLTTVSDSSFASSLLNVIYDSAYGNVFAVGTNASGSGGLVSEINHTNNSIEFNINVGVYPSEISCNPAAKEFYIVDSASPSLLILRT